MVDAMKTATPSKSKQKKAPTVRPKRTNRQVPASQKSKADVPPTDDDDEAPVLKKLGPRLPARNDEHPLVENMKERKGKGLQKWREADPYTIRRRTAVDSRFHTREQQDFYETVLVDKKPIVSDMRYVDWKFIDNNADRFPHVHDNFRDCGINDFFWAETHILE